MINIKLLCSYSHIRLGGVDTEVVVLAVPSFSKIVPDELWICLWSSKELCNVIKMLT